jgi:hypothetical protein
VQYFSARVLAAMENMELAALYNGNGRALQTVKDILISRICAAICGRTILRMVGAAAALETPLRLRHSRLASGR